LKRAKQWAWAAVAACLVATLAVLAYVWQSSGVGPSAKRALTPRAAPRSCSLA